MSYAAVRHLGPGAGESPSGPAMDPARMPWEMDGEQLHARQETWLLSFIDILALLLTLFVLLLAFQQRGGPRPETGSGPAAPDSELFFTLVSPADPDPLQHASADGFAMPGNGLIPLGARPAPAPRQAETAADQSAPAREAVASGQTDVGETAVRAQAVQVPQNPVVAVDSAPDVAQAQAATAIAADPQTVAAEAAQPAATEVQSESAEVSESQPVAALPDAAAMQTAEALLQGLRDSDLGQGVEVSARSGAVDLVISDSILFAPASAALSAQGQALLDQLAAILNTLPYSVSVEGHTDNVPIHTRQYPSNWELSAARASRVTRQLIAQGVASDRLRAIGYGDTRPRSDNSTPGARAQNRRVTFVLQVE